MRYVDGFVLPVPKKKLQAYRRMAQKAGKIWREHGALEFRECVADDVKPGKRTSFPQSVKLKKGETVMFSLHRVQVARAPRPRQRQGDEGPAHRGHGWTSKNMPFDAKRMIYGGFKVMVDA